MGLDVQIARGVEEIGKEVWDQLSGGRPFTSYRWYRFGEVVMEGEAPAPVYITVIESGRPVGRATFWLVGQEYVPTNNRQMRSVLESILRRRPLLMCAAPLSTSSGLVLPDDPHLRSQTLEVLSLSAQEYAAESNASFVAFGYLCADEAKCNGWPEEYMRVSFLNQGTILPVEWPDFDAYVGSLSKSMRKDYRRHCNRAADQGITLARHKSSSELSDWRRAKKLVQNVNEKHRLPFLTTVREWRIMEHADQADSTWISAKIEDELVGWALLLSDGGVMHLSILGIDYGIRYTYFQLFYEAIRCAIEEGKSAIRGGYAAYDTKRRLGFRLEGETSVRFVGNGAFLQKVARWVADRFQEDEL